MLLRLGLIFDEHTPVELTLTTMIETAFQRGKKVGIASVDLTAAYDTVWKDGLLLKVMKTFSCLRIFNLLDAMLSSRKYRVHMGDKIIRWKSLNDGLAQGSVLAPKFFNLYTSDSPGIESRKIKY